MTYLHITLYSSDMDPLDNPYTPGAGSRPKELAGRDSEIELFERLLGRLERGNHDRSIILWGLRGVGKTVLLNEFEEKAKAKKWAVGKLEATSYIDFRTEMSVIVQEALLDMSVVARAKKKLQKVLELLKNFKAQVPTGIEGLSIEMGLTIPSLERDMKKLLVALGEVAQENDTGVLFLIDELQLLHSESLEGLIAAIHEIGQQELPIALVGAGLPGLQGKLAEAKSYAERIFAFPELGKLLEEDAKLAIMRPAERVFPEKEKVIEEAAVAAIFQFSQGYPMFIQTLGKHSWNQANGEYITLEDVQNAQPLALMELDRELFLTRYQRATPAERNYLAAMASSGTGPYTTSKIAEKLKKRPTDFSKIRKNLIDKGVIYAPEYKQTDFTVPHFDDYMRRVHPLLSGTD